MVKVFDLLNPHPKKTTFIYLEPLTPVLTNEKPFDTNTFVLKRKERRKAPTPTNENSFNGVCIRKRIILIKKISLDY